MKRNLPIIIGIALPIVLVLALIIATSLEGRSIKPAYDFLYTNPGDRYNVVYENNYAVKEGEITTIPNPDLQDQLNRGYNPTNKEDITPIYRYDVSTDTVKELTKEEVVGLKVDKGPSSSDGYSVVLEYRRHYDLFSEIFGGGRRDEYNAYIVKGDKEKGILLTDNSDRNNYYNNRQFIGWINE